MAIEEKYFQKRFSVTEQERKNLKENPSELERLEGKINNANLALDLENAKDLVFRTQNKFTAVKDYFEQSLSSWKKEDYETQMQNLDKMENNLSDINEGAHNENLSISLDELKENIEELRKAIVIKFSNFIGSATGLDSIHKNHEAKKITEEKSVKAPESPTKPSLLSRFTSFFRRDKNKKAA